MTKRLSYVILTPYTISKSRTGGVIARLLSRTDLELVGARIFAADRVFTEKYAELLRESSPQNQLMLLPEYVKTYFSPSGDRPHRTLFLLFKGENPCEHLMNVCGHLYTQHIERDALSGETIRDTYSDLIFDSNNPNELRYFEPAVLTPRHQLEANAELKLIADFLDGKENLVQNFKHKEPKKVERTLVIIKPENWKKKSTRPGQIIDMFSRTGLRIIGMKIHHFSLSQAMDFYGPVESILKKKLAPDYGEKAKDILEKEFKFQISSKLSKTLISDFGNEYARDQFHQIVEFMSGKRPNGQTREELEKPGDVKCMIMVYEGENAVQRIRDVLGATNPDQATDGTIRSELGSSIMVNSGHASDSVKSYEREQKIVNINDNPISSIIREHIGG